MPNEDTTQSQQTTTSTEDGKKPEQVTSGAEGTGSETTATDPKDEPKFTQAQLEVIIAKRLKQERQKSEQKAKEETLPELEKTRLQNERLQEENRQIRAEKDVLAAAINEKANYPDAIFKLIKDDLTYDEQGKAINIQAVIKATKAQYPALFSKSSPNPGNANAGAQGKSPGPTMNQIIRSAAGLN